LRTENEYLYNPQHHYSNGYESIKKDAKANCIAGEKRKTVEQIEEVLRIKSRNLGIDFPKSTIDKCEIIHFSWEDIKREGTYSFRDEEAVYYAKVLNDQRRGKWKFLEDKRLIQIDWQENQYKPANREI